MSLQNLLAHYEQALKDLREAVSLLEEVDKTLAQAIGKLQRRATGLRYALGAVDQLDVDQPAEAPETTFSPEFPTLEATEEVFGPPEILPPSAEGPNDNKDEGVVIIDSGEGPTITV